MEPERPLLFPPSPLTWLPQNHWVDLPLDLGAEPSMEEIYADYRQHSRHQLRKWVA